MGKVLSLANNANDPLLSFAVSDFKIRFVTQRPLNNMATDPRKQQESQDGSELK